MSATFLASSICPICGLRKGRPNNHAKCSRILQQQRLASNIKSKTPQRKLKLEKIDLMVDFFKTLER